MAGPNGMASLLAVEEGQNSVFGVLDLSFRSRPAQRTFPQDASQSALSEQT